MFVYSKESCCGSQFSNTFLQNANCLNFIDSLSMNYCNTKWIDRAYIKALLRYINMNSNLSLVGVKIRLFGLQICAEI